jgi:NAD(P) transhydrogenase subunit alpha
MSATNAISGVTVLGALVVCATNTDNILILVLSLIAIVLATINTVGGYVVTDRMLGMFRKKEGKK